MKLVIVKYFRPNIFYNKRWTVFMTIMTIGFWPLLIYFGSRRYVSKITKKEIVDFKGRNHQWKDLQKIIHFEFDESRSHLTGYSIYEFSKGKVVVKKEFIKNSGEVDSFIKSLKLKAPTEYKALAV